MRGSCSWTGKCCQVSPRSRGRKPWWLNNSCSSARPTPPKCDAVWCGWCGVVWCGVVWCGVVRCGVVGVVWCGAVWCGVVLCGVVGVVWFGVMVKDWLTNEWRKTDE